MLNPWRWRGTRDPADLIEYTQAVEAKHKHGCLACKRRPALIGGNGKCTKGRKGPGCGFLHDEGGMG